MPSLKSYRLRIRSVQSTQKITKAMKMVAAAKLRRAQEQAMAARPYAEAMDKVMATLASSFKGGVGPKLLSGTGSDNVHLLIVATADRGLCGAFNSSIVREARRVIRAMLADGKTVKVLCIGRKARDQLRRDFGSLIIDTVTDLGRPRLSFGDAQKVSIDFKDGSSASVFRSESKGRAVILTDGMAAPPPGKVYELWLQNSAGTMIPAGLMPRSPNAKVLLRGDASRATAVGITVEPDGGSKAPTSEPIALFDFKGTA